MKNIGFTLVEVLVIMSIFVTLLGLSTISLLHAKYSSSLSSSLNTFITDLKQQQLKAMLGDTEGRATTDNYGIFFGSGNYTLFHGIYSITDPDNSIIPLGDNIQFSDVAFPGSQIIFLKGSGEIFNYSDGSNTITLKDAADNNQQKITLNRYGVVTQLQ